MALGNAQDSAGLGAIGVFACLQPPRRIIDGLYRIVDRGDDCATAAVAGQQLRDECFSVPMPSAKTLLELRVWCGKPR